MVGSDSFDDAELAESAFGELAGRWPLPRARTPRGLWWRAVAAGGQGRYASATADLRALRTTATGPLLSLTYSTEASFRRQLGWHDDGRARDGCAWSLAGGDVEASVDALVGLAADALGVGRFGAASALLDRAHAVVDDADPTGVPRRLPLRLQWVRAELAMVSGQGQVAVEHAGRAAQLAAADGIGARHRVKTAMVVAAAHCSVGDLDAARTVAGEALAGAGHFGLLPLRWALASLLADFGGGESTRDDLLAVRDTSAEAVRIAGGRWRHR